MGCRNFAGQASAQCSDRDSVDARLRELAQAGLDREHSLYDEARCDEANARVWIEYCALRMGLFVFGAGDDAKPLLRLANEMGWHVTVAVGRSHLATRTRFASAENVAVLNQDASPREMRTQLDIRASDAAVLMTHSFEQDAKILAALLDPAADYRLAYIGVLGPQRRTREVLADAAQPLLLPPSDERVENWLELLHAPVGLDLGSDSPATIALSVIAEMQKVLSAATALPLREVRGCKVTSANR